MRSLKSRNSCEAVDDPDVFASGRVTVEPLSWEDMSGWDSDVSLSRAPDRYGIVGAFLTPINKPTRDESTVLFLRRVA
ncbi:hypothetical protein P3T16_001913 [Paraburkholderia sp. GAS42]|jgi:hypothetical protein